jgi:hypothetical protein
MGPGRLSDNLLAAKLKRSFEDGRPPVGTDAFGARLQLRAPSAASCECSLALRWLVRTLAAHDARLRLELRGALATRLREALVKHVPKLRSHCVCVVDRTPIGLCSGADGRAVNWVTEWTLVLPPVRGNLPPLRLPPRVRVVAESDEARRVGGLSRFQLRGLSGRLAAWRAVACGTVTRSTSTSTSGSVFHPVVRRPRDAVRSSQLAMVGRGRKR